MKRPPGYEALFRTKTLRREQTEAEKLLWKHLRNRQVASAKFRRQVWIGQYIADFYCAEAKLVVEADGGQHGNAKAYDERRDAFMKAEGIRVLRFWNNEVLGNIAGVIDVIMQALHMPSPSHPAAPGGPRPLPQGEREL